MSHRINFSWKVGHSDGLEIRPTKYVDATVPGNVQLDWGKAENMPEYWYGTNYEQYIWMEDKFWHYETTLQIEKKSGLKPVLTFVGIDYEYIIKVDGKQIYYNEGLYTSPRLDLSFLEEGEHKLEVVIYPIPKRPVVTEKGRQEAQDSLKPACAYGWDWHPRLVPLGIYDEAYMEYLPECYIVECYFGYSMSDDLKTAHINTEISVSQAPTTAKLELFDANGKLVLESFTEITDKLSYIKADFENPLLWWPTGYGEQNLYTARITLANGHVWEKRVGFRRSKLIMNKGEWERRLTYPMGCNRSPITLEINGLPIFGKGSNMLEPDIFPGQITEKTYRDILEKVKECNMNLLRMWGGCMVSKDSFFDICDELGIMVWQELFLACGLYPDTDKFLDVLDKESKVVIKRIRRHPCNVMWCGGNELFNNWSKMTNQSLPLRLLDRNTYDYDRQTPYIMASPIDGMSHGHYIIRDMNTGVEVIQNFINSDSTAYTEFGAGGPSPVEYIKKIMPEEDYNNFSEGRSWEAHHAVKAWDKHSWIRMHEIESYFGTASFEQTIENGTKLQSEGFRHLFEEARRQWPYCSMALNWCLNEPWPSAGNNSLINWPCEPKPAFYGVKNALRPHLASARLKGMIWQAGKYFEAELWMLNDSLTAIEKGKVAAYILINSEKIKLITWDYDKVEAQTNLPGPIIKYLLPKAENGQFKLLLEVENHPEMNSEYLCFCHVDGKPVK